MKCAHINVDVYFENYRVATNSAISYVAGNLANFYETRYRVLPTTVERINANDNPNADLVLVSQVVNYAAVALEMGNELFITFNVSVGIYDELIVLVNYAVNDLDVQGFQNYCNFVNDFSTYSDAMDYAVIA